MNTFMRLCSPALLVCLCICNCSSQSAEKPIVRFAFIAEPGCLDHALARVSFVGRPFMCSVEESPGKPGREMTCASVGEYLRKSLNPPKGAIVGLISGASWSVDATTALFDGLTTHGFEAGSTECYVSKPTPSDR